MVDYIAVLLSLPLLLIAAYRTSPFFFLPIPAPKQMKLFVTDLSRFTFTGASLLFPSATPGRITRGALPVPGISAVML